MKRSQIRMDTAEGLVKFLESLCNAVVDSDVSRIPLESLLQRIQAAVHRITGNFVNTHSVPTILSSSSNAKAIWEVYKKSTVKKEGAITSSCGDT